MNIAEFCQEFRISQKKAKAMQSRGVLLLVDDDTAQAAAIRQSLIKGQPLSALQLVHLVESPSALMQLGRYASKASDQLDAIGDALGERAPIEIAAAISDAARGDRESLEALAAWLVSVLPVEPVGHSWIAARLLLALPANIREFDAPRIPRALMRCRKIDSFAGAWRYSSRSGRKFTLYQRPKNPLADWDL
jgi:hypothetical protein